jgi:hypothetical protein
MPRQGLPPSWPIVRSKFIHIRDQISFQVCPTKGNVNAFKRLFGHAWRRYLDQDYATIERVVVVRPTAAGAGEVLLSDWIVPMQPNLLTDAIEVVAQQNGQQRCYR